MRDTLETQEAIVALIDHYTDDTLVESDTAPASVNKGSGQLLWSRRYDSGQNDRPR